MTIALTGKSDQNILAANDILDHMNDILRTDVSYLIDRDGVTIASSNRHIISIAITEDGDRAPWLEKLGERLPGLIGSRSGSIDKWRSLALRHKQKIREILNRELQYSGVIEENTTYSSRLLAIFGIQRSFIDAPKPIEK